MEYLKNILKIITDYIKAIDFRKIAGYIVTAYDYIISACKISPETRELMLHDLKKTKAVICSKNSMNILVEISILLTMYSVGGCLFFEASSALQFITEIFLLICAYFAAYYFLPKWEFEFKTLSLYLISIVILCPALLFTHSQEEILTLGQFMITFSLLIGISFRFDIQNASLPNIFLLSEVDVSSNMLKILQEKYNILAVVKLNEFSDFHINCRKFNSLLSASRWLKIVKILPIFSFPQRVIYLHENFRDHLDSVCSFCNNYGLNIYTCEATEITSRPLSTDFLYDDSTMKSEITQQSLLPLLKGKNVWISYDGNPLICYFIKLLCSIPNIIVTVFCSGEKTADHIYEKLGTINFTIKLSSIVMDMHAEPDYVFWNLPFTSEVSAETDLKESVTANVKKTLEIIDACDSNRVKGLYILSNSDAQHIEHWNGIAQRLAELYAQHASFSTRSLNIFPLRLPKTPLDVFSTVSSFKRDISTFAEIRLKNGEYKKVFDINESLDLLVRFIVYSLSDQITPGRVYSLVPSKPIAIKSFAEFIAAIYGVKVNIDDSSRENKHPLPMINEEYHNLDIKGCFYTEFIKGKRYNLSEIKNADRAKSIIDLSKAILSSVYDKLGVEKGVSTD